MNNLRISSVIVNSSTKITINFTEKLNKNITVDNFSIISETVNVPDSKVLLISVANNYVELGCQPLTPYAVYYVTAQSTLSKPVQSLHGDAILLEDGVANRSLISGPVEPNNPIRDFFRNFLRDNIYNIDDTTTLVSKAIESFVQNLSKTLYDIKQSRNENYLKFEITDEQKVRGEGPYDRLLQEGAYEITRVARNKTGNSVSSSTSISSFPSFPVTLQAVSTKETLTIDSSDIEGKFNINELILNLRSSPVTKLKRVTFTLNTLPVTYEYDISVYGYQIKNNTYDKEFSSNYYLLNDNQIKLNNEILTEINFKLESIVSVSVEFEYKDIGKLIYGDSLILSNVLVSNREVLNPLVTIFDLKHAPIVNIDGTPATSNGVTFTNVNVVGSTSHPAFLYEIPFRLNALPSAPGYYSIDYSVGRVYVYGESSNNDGTGATPPVATYKYKQIYQNEVDYVFDSDTKDLVSLPNGNLRDNAVNINFNYEKVLIPGIDYIAEVHVENLSERIENRLLDLGTIQTLNSPITNVFRVYNETSGEIYAINRWDQSKIYFGYNIPPKVSDKIFEKTNFENIVNELLVVNNTYINGSSIKIYEIYLSNSNIIAQTEDCIGSSINSSVYFSNQDIFVNNKFYERTVSSQLNYDRLVNIGEYCIDYVNGIVYCAVSNTLQSDLGTVSYKKENIIPENKHLISVNDIYYQITPLNPKNKTFKYISFADGSIVPDSLQFSDEQYLNDNPSSIYQVYNSKIGAFDSGAVFTPRVSEQIKYIRGIFEYNDLLNNVSPLNFAIPSTFSTNTITVGAINNSIITNVLHDIDGYYVNVNIDLAYLSPNISLDISILRSSDGYQLWDNSGTIVAGSPLRLTLSGVNDPNVGDVVLLTYIISINDLSRVIVDYNKGDLYVDYTYLADEIIISYEYGDNDIDFRQSQTLATDDTYYVSYKVGALRDALLKNFGSLLNIDELNTFNITLDRERYRDALMAAMTATLQGPTINAIKDLIATITHIKPELIESVFENWSLGNSILYPNKITDTDNFELLPAKFGNGALINKPGQSITMPMASNISLTQGTFETWVLNQWNGIDNTCDVTFRVFKNDGYISENLIFIGQEEYHPTYADGYTFTVNKSNILRGEPLASKNGVYINYYADGYLEFDRWYITIVDNNSTGSTYSIQVSSDGKLYDTKCFSGSSNVSLTTRNNKLNIKLSNFTEINESIGFICEKDHYIMDVGGKDNNKNRISIYKDVSGYLNFVVYDKDKTSYGISHDVSSWKSGDLHFVCASWKLNTDNNKDEMHLFIDGLEVPNIIKYGEKLSPYTHEKFRTINPEEFIGISGRDILGSVDLSTVMGSNVVSSSSFINFSSYLIVPGIDKIYIDDPSFNASGYVIESVDGNNLILDSAMPITSDNLTYSINKTSYNLQTEAAIYPNIAISTIGVSAKAYDFVTTSASNEITSSTLNFSLVKSGYLVRLLNNNFDLTYVIIGIDALNNKLLLNSDMPVSLTGLTGYVYSDKETEISGVNAVRPSYSISTDSEYNSILTITNNVYSDEIILLRTLGLNHRKINKSYYIWSDSLENIIPTRLPPPISLDDVKITKVITENTVVNSSPMSLTYDQPTTSQTGRGLTATLSGTNIDFSTPTTVDISGVDGYAFSITETLTFNDYGSVSSTNKFVSVSGITITSLPINPSKSHCAVKIRETYPITHSEDSSYSPVIRYSYQMAGGTQMYGDGYTVYDGYNLLSSLLKDNILIIQSPLSAAGFYKISSVGADLHSLTIESTLASNTMPLPSFTDAIYKVVNVTDYRTGLQNGFFTLQQSILASEPYRLRKGYYDFEYYTYMSAKFDPVSNEQIFIGSDIKSSNQFDGLIDGLKIYSVMLTDTRVGETLPTSHRSVTKDFNSLIKLTKDINTLVLLDFDSYPFVNASDYYKKYIGGDFIQSSVSINDNFNNSVLLNKPIVIDNDGILNTKQGGTIEFWVNPLFDSANDPNERYYFDAYGAKTVIASSTNNCIVQIPDIIQDVISVTLENGDQSIDYFAGGRLEINVTNGIVEQGTSTSDVSVNISQKALQVISVTISNDPSQKDYFDGGALSADRTTIYLGKQLPAANVSLLITYKPLLNSDNKINTQIIKLNKKLPKDNCSVIVKYIPQGFNGDRISIFKDKYGSLNFKVRASNQDYTVACPIYWSRNTWHRVKASYSVNSQNTNDELRLFVDGYERSSISLDGYMVLNNFFTLGAMKIGTGLVTNIIFKDIINQIYIGSDYSLVNTAHCLLDNLRISNISRPIYAPYGEAIDSNYSSNLNVVYPVANDLYTTYILDFNSLVAKNTDFTSIVAKDGGYFDFFLNIFDSFGIVSSSDTVKQILEKLIEEMKPANNRAFINYSS